jgi:hypothetical protein
MIQKHYRCKNRTQVRSRRGQGIIEAAVAAIILIPIVLALFDFLVIVIGNQMNDTACKNAARAAANQPTIQLAKDSALNSLGREPSSPFVRKLEFGTITYNPGESVGILTRVTIALPIPFPGWSIVVNEAQDIEPIVGAAPPS